MNHITADAETLMRQASMTADEYLREAVRRIDAQMGAGYAAQNPVLVGAFMAAAAQDFATSMAAVVRQDTASEVVSGLHALAEAVSESGKG